MRYADLMAIAARALRASMRRTLLSLLGVAIGVAAVLVLTALGDGARGYVHGQFASLGANLIAVLPGNYRPRLQPGMPMRIQMMGYAYAYSDIAIDTIGDQVVGPNEIRRFLPSELADTLPIQGPVVLVTATLPSSTFEAEGKTYDYFDGMQGTAAARVGSKMILLTLIPGLEAFL